MYLMRCHLVPFPLRSVPLSRWCHHPPLLHLKTLWEKILLITQWGATLNFLLRRKSYYAVSRFALKSTPLFSTPLSPLCTPVTSPVICGIFVSHRIQDSMLYYCKNFSCSIKMVTHSFHKRFSSNRSVCFKQAIYYCIEFSHWDSTWIRIECAQICSFDPISCWRCEVGSSWCTAQIRKDAVWSWFAWPIA